MASASSSSEKSEREVDVRSENIPLTFSSKDLVATGLYKCDSKGGFISMDCWNSTDFIDVSRFVAIRYELSSYNRFYSIAFFDGDKKFLSGKVTESNLEFTVLVGHTPVPERAKNARFINFDGDFYYRYPPESIV